jgi:hypothetical protein
MRHSFSIGFCSLLCLIAVRCVAADAATEEKKAENITFFKTGSIEVPAEFKRVPPKSRIVEHEFQASVGEGDDAQTARVYMMPSGGGVEPNIKRWYSQFSNGDKEAQKSTEMKLGGWKVHIVDASGDFQERMGGGPFAGGKVVTRTNHAMTGAIFVNPEGRMYFAKLIGPAKVVKKHRQAFLDMVKSIEK